MTSDSRKRNSLENVKYLRLYSGVCTTGFDKEEWGGGEGSLIMYWSD